MVVKRQEDELAQAKAIVDNAEKTQIKAFCKAVDTKRRDMVKVQKKLRMELFGVIRVKAVARAKRLGIFV